MTKKKHKPASGGGERYKKAGVTWTRKGGKPVRKRKK